jgi:hypothetical protein
MANVIIDVAAEFTGKKAFKDAGNATSSLEKSVKTLGKTIGITFSAKAIVDFSKASVKAFAEDDRAIRVLRTNLKNLGLAYQSVNADNFIKNMEAQAAVSDDLLRPAYAQLAKVTLSTTKTQELMALAFDLSHANGIDFASTVDILSNAYVGNYKGLKQLYTGLTQAQLASKSFEEIQAILTKQSKGAGKAAIDTYAGSVDKLSIAADNAKESIGKGLVDLFAALAGNGNIDEATANINTFSEALGQMLSDAAKYNALDWLSAFVTGNVTESTAQKLVKRPSARRFFTGGSGVSTELLTARKLAAAEAARLKAIKDAAAAKLKADKLAAANKLKLDKASAVFNMQNIQIAAALKGKISEEEKTRLLLMQAIADEDATKAETLQKKLEDIQKKNAEIAADLLAIGAAKDPFATWAGSLSKALAELGKVGLGISAISGTMIPGVTYNPGQNTDRNYDEKVKAAEKAAADKAAADKAAADKAAADKEAADRAAAIKPTFEPDDTIDDILAKVENVAEAAAEAAQAAAASVTESQTTVDALAASATNGSSAAGTNYNPSQNRDRNYDSGYMTPPVTVNVNVEGSVISQNEMTKIVADALIVADTEGLSTRRPGAIGFRAE